MDNERNLITYNLKPYKKTKNLKPTVMFVGTYLPTVFTTTFKFTVRVTQFEIQ